jgi:uncharacterized protein DUF3943
MSLRMCLQLACVDAILSMSSIAYCQTEGGFPVGVTPIATSAASAGQDSSIERSDPFPYGSLNLRLETAGAQSEVVPSPQYPPGYGSMFMKAWLPVTAAEVVLLGVTASLPKSWTGWSAHFVRDGINHLERAYTRPPVWDSDWWFHNYVGHPYGGSLYYNSVRSQGASPAQSLLFSAVLSTQWEYFFEAFAERPSIQDLIVTPVAGSLLGELTHQLTLELEKGGTSTGEKVIIFVTNPMHVVFDGF